MFSVEQDFQLRISETNGLITLVKNLDEGKITSPDAINISVIRSSVIVSLYNIVESTITQTLTKIHSEINTKEVSYNSLSKEIKDLALIYFYKHKEKRSNIHDSIEVLHHTVDLIRGEGVFNVPYSELAENYQLYSGNLDAKSIRKVMKKYGIIISEDFGQKIKKIKDGRNQLSHGNISFEEFGRNIVLNTLNEYLLDVENLLTEVINKTSQYLEEEKYQTAVSGL